MLDDTATHSDLLKNTKCRFREETFARQRIETTILAQYDIVRRLYMHVAVTRDPSAGASANEPLPALSSKRLRFYQPLTDEELCDHTRKSAPDKHGPQN